MVMDYSVTKKDNDSVVVVAHNNNEFDEIICDDKDDIDMQIIKRNQVEYIDDKNKALKKNIKVYEQDKKIALIGYGIISACILGCTIFYLRRIPRIYPSLMVSGITLETVAAAVSFYRINYVSKIQKKLKNIVKLFDKNKNKILKEEDAYIKHTSIKSLKIVDNDKIYRVCDDAYNDCWYKLNKNVLIKAEAKFKRNDNVNRLCKKYDRVYEAVNTNPNTTNYISKRVKSLVKSR